MIDHETYLDVGAPPRGLFNRPGTRATRAQRIAHGATQLGISVEMYELHVEAGERWCSGHGRWCPAEDFGSTKGSCRAGHAEAMRARYAQRRATKDGLT